MPERILVVDDERPMAQAMQQVLTRGGFDVDVVHDGCEALAALERRPYALVLTDLRMPTLGGQELVRRVRTITPTTRIVVVTAFGTVESAVTCVREGADDYLMKPFSPEALVAAVQAALGRGSVAPATVAAEIIAEDPAVLGALALARRAAASDATVLLEAESGAGKEVFARVIHRESGRSQNPFVAINCAALPRELLEAELFGHVRGAFTGALRDRRGHFQSADGGTLLLDEIGEMSPDLQARLLRVLQDQFVQPVGSDVPVRINVRVIAATHRNLRELVASGRFREDLYYRLCVLPLRIPPLRERPADIEPLARHFLRREAGEKASITAQAVDRLREHSWPGNVRELENVIRRAIILAGGDVVDLRHLQIEPAPQRGGKSSAVSLDDAERDAIKRVLERTRGNRGAAAEALGISPRTLRHKLKRYRDEGSPLEEALA